MNLRYSKQKVKLLNDQFKSVFTLTKYPTISNLIINTKWVEKLLQKRKINKASRPDDLPAYVVRHN